MLSSQYSYSFEIFHASFIEDGVTGGSRTFSPVMNPVYGSPNHRDIGAVTRCGASSGTTEPSANVV